MTRSTGGGARRRVSWTAARTRPPPRVEGSNYVAVAAAQYLERGDVATVTMQYSKRPSPRSLGKVKDAREQNRLLWLRILERLRN
jgi:Alpha/beta-hydrolase family